MKSISAALISIFIAAATQAGLTNYIDSVESPSDGGAGPALWYQTAEQISGTHMLNSGTAGASYTAYRLGEATHTDYFGNAGNAFGISGANNSAAVAGSTGLFMTSPTGTVSVLFKTPASLANAGLFRQGSAFELLLLGAGNARLTVNGTYLTLPSIKVDTWYYLALRWDATAGTDNLTWYMGEAGGTLSSGTTTITGTGASGSIDICGRVSYYKFTGAMQNFAFYERTLSDAAVRNQFNQTLPAIPFPEVAGPDSLIANSDFTQATNETVSGKATYRVTGSNGDYPTNEGNYSDVVDWLFYCEDPNHLADYTDAGEVLDGTDKLSTSFKPAAGLIYLNSAMDYRNGMVQTDILNGVTINPSLNYEFSVDVVQVDSTDHSLTTFTAALTAGAGTAATNIANALTGALLQVAPTTNLPTASDTPYLLPISGSDLLAAQSGGQVNVMFDSLNTDTITGFPAGPVNPVDPTEVSQLFVKTVSLTFTPPAGDGNKNGVVDRQDLQNAQLYLAGDGGEPAVDRQNALIGLGYTGAEALAFLNLELYDMDADDDFDADDVAAIDALAPPFLLQITESGATLDFEWGSLPGKVYDLESRLSLSGAGWTAYEGNTNIPADVGGINSMTNIPTSDPARFFRVIEKD